MTLPFEPSVRDRGFGAALLVSALCLALACPSELSAARFGMPDGPTPPPGYFILTGPDVPTDADNQNWGDETHALDLFIEVTGSDLLVILYDPGLVSASAGNLDAWFNGVVGQVTYTLYDPAGLPVVQTSFQADTEGPGGTNLDLVPLYDGPAAPGLYRLGVTMDDTATADEDINAFGVSVPGYDVFSYYFTGGESNLAGASITEPLLLYPLVNWSFPGDFGGVPITGIDVITHDLDASGNTPPPDVRLTTTTARSVGLDPSDDNQLFTTNLRGLEVGLGDGTDYGRWTFQFTNLDQVMEGTYDINVFSTQICRYDSGVDVSEFPLAGDDARRPFKIYYPRDDGTAPHKESMTHWVRVASGASPPVVGAASELEITLAVSNPAAYDLTGIDITTSLTPDPLFSDPWVEDASPGLAAAAVGRTVAITGTVPAFGSGLVRYRTTFSPTATGIYYVTGDGTDLQGGALPTQGTYNTPFVPPPQVERLGPIHMLRIEAVDSTCSITARIQGDLAICEGDLASLRASGSVVRDCPGLNREYRWTRDGIEILPFPGPEVIAETPSVDTVYGVEVRCAALPDCNDYTEVQVLVTPDVPPQPVGNTLHLARETEDIRLTWTPNGSFAYNVRRHDDRTFDRATSQLLWTLTAGQYLATRQVGQPPALAHYRVFAANCAGTEEP